MSRRACGVFAGAIGAMVAGPRDAAAIDAPHPSTCSDCHAFRGSSGLPHLLGVYCTDCHVSGGSAPEVETHSSRTTTDTYGDWDLDCWACHNPHFQEQDREYGTSYGMFVKVDLQAEIKEIDPTGAGPYYPPLSILRTVTSNIEFTSNTGFVDGDGQTDDDICQACHTRTSNFNSLTAIDTHTYYGPDSQPGGECTICHPHESGFLPGGSGCPDCHSNAQGRPTKYRRQVAGSGGDFERASHHVDDGSGSEIVTADDCQVCHDQSNHARNVDPGALLNDPDGGSSYTYDGTGASVEGMCAGCHDDDGPLAWDSDGDSSNGLQPFSDGQDPPAVAGDWATASHGTSSATEIAQDRCLACHGGTDSTQTGATADRNAHGSDQETLFSETVAGVAIANTEEDLCTACHDGSVASSDILGELTEATNGTLIYHHPLASSEQSAGREVECTDCHDPHRASASDLLAGVYGTTLAGASVGPDPSPLEYELCFECHGDSYNTSRSRTSNKRTDFATTNSAFHPVAGAGRNTSSNMGAQLVGGYATTSTMKCTDCHNNEETADVKGPASGSANGPQGPHGSTNPYILRAAYWSDPTGPSTWSSANFALCFLCHDVTKLVTTSSYTTGARTNFASLGLNLHYTHLVSKASKLITCANCHYNVHSNQSQGSASGGNTIWRIGTTNYTSPPATAKTRLVSFSPDATAVTGVTKPTWVLNTSTRQRTCLVACHGRSHTSSRYIPGTGDDDRLTIP